MNELLSSRAIVIRFRFVNGATFNLSMADFIYPDARNDDEPEWSIITDEYLNMFVFFLSLSLPLSAHMSSTIGVFSSCGQNKTSDKREKWQIQSTDSFALTRTIHSFLLFFFFERGEEFFLLIFYLQQGEERETRRSSCPNRFVSISLFSDWRRDFFSRLFLMPFD